MGIDSRLLIALVAFVAFRPSVADISDIAVKSDPRVVCDRVDVMDLQQAHVMLKYRCGTLLDSFPSTVEDDEARISAKGVDYVEQMFAAFRASKKRMLKTCINTPFEVWRDKCEFFVIFEEMEKLYIEVKLR